MVASDSDELWFQSK